MEQTETLKAFMHKHKIRSSELADLLETSRQNVSNWLGGVNIPFEKIKEWADNHSYDPKVKELARDLWITQLRGEIAEITNKQSELEALLIGA